MKVALGGWGEAFPPAIKVPVPGNECNNQNADPVPGIFQQITAIAATSSLLPRANPSISDSEEEAATETSNTASDASSGWESEQSIEDGMDVEALPLDVDTGGTTFATS